MVNVLSCIDLNSGAIDSAYEKVEDLLHDLHMKQSAERVMEQLIGACSNSFDWSEPSRSVIRNMFILTTEEIKRELPEAMVSFTIPYSDGYSADINVDNATYTKAKQRFEEV